MTKKQGVTDLESRNMLRSENATLKEKFKVSQELVGNLAEQLQRAQEVILASLPALRQAYKCAYDWHEQEGAEGKFLREDNTINYYTVYYEAKEVLGLK